MAYDNYISAYKSMNHFNRLLHVEIKDYLFILKVHLYVFRESFQRRTFRYDVYCSFSIVGDIFFRIRVPLLSQVCGEEFEISEESPRTYAEFVFWEFAGLHRRFDE